MIGISYSVMVIIAIAIHCIVNADTLFYKNENNINQATLCHQRLLWGILLYYGTDILWGIFDGFRMVDALRVDTFVYYIAMSLMVVLWTDYVVEYLKQESIFGKFVRSFGKLFLSFVVLSLIINIFKPIFFSFDDNGQYHAGAIRYLVLYIQIILFLLATVQTLFVAARSKGVKRRRHFSISMVSLAMSVTIYVQLFQPMMPIYTIGLLVGTCFLRIYVREDEKDEYYSDLKKHMDMVSAMAGIFFCSYYVDMKNKTYIQIDNKINENKDVIEETGDAVENLNKMCQHLVLPEYRNDVQEFVNLENLEERLKDGRYYLSMEFKTVHIGWAEGLFITGDHDKDGKLSHVIWAIRNIQEAKEKEETILYNSYVDELTGVYNRKMYVADTEGEENTVLKDGIRPVDINGDDFVLISMDVNGLKAINDNQGHAAGDELIKAAAYCMKSCMSKFGRVYRTGGDEFIALLNVSSSQLDKIKKNFELATSRYNGRYIDSLSVSCGYVFKREHPDLSFIELERLADKEMYEAKRIHYSNGGIDRRLQQQSAYQALCALYTKILLINLTEDNYSIISMDENEKTEKKGFSLGIYDWLENFAKLGQVHPEDREEFLSKTNREYLPEFFKQGGKNLRIQYRRKVNSEFKLAEMEMIPTEDYSHENQKLYLYVKNLENS